MGRPNGMGTLEDHKGFEASQFREGTGEGG